MLILCLCSCRSKQVDLSGDTPIQAAEFIAAFRKITTTFNVADTNISRKADTLTIGRKALAQFIPDSAITALAGKSSQLVIHPVGIIEKEKENYFLVNFTGRRKTSLVVFVTDKNIRFLGGKELLSDNHDDGYAHSLAVNREPTFIISQEKTGKDNNLRFTRTGWVYNNAGLFMVVINDSNEDPHKTAVINPIDTLARKHKLSGDYVQDKKNYVSLRDGKNPNTYLFFIHFEKDGGNCTGELKGVLVLKTATAGQFTANGDPCIIDFIFEGNDLSIKEHGSCGNHRGIKCYFDDTFRKKKEPRSGRRPSR